ncbi:Casparian strip membrane protein [Parasponia andersonii]|uniref:CASP-like protein n=1 Tax=Parasponia andersonii TaxID=3476 RepID=A0A2P5E402_PARAD|nr:Casparian strip membrane protein [Parasponia andersonii]
MASTDKPDPEQGKEVTPPPKPGSSSVASLTAASYLSVDVTLRVLLFASTLTAIVVLVTSKQTVRGRVPIPLVAKFDHSPAFIYFLVALSVAGLYSIITTLASISVILKPEFSTKFLLHFAFWDVLILGLVASATGTAGGVAYIGLKGNEHVQWQKVCSTFDKFCRHLAGSLAVSLFASVLLVLLVWFSVFSIHKKLPK